MLPIRDSDPNIYMEAKKYTVHLTSFRTQKLCNGLSNNSIMCIISEEANALHQKGFLCVEKKCSQLKRTIVGILNFQYTFSVDPYRKKEMHTLQFSRKRPHLAKQRNWANSRKCSSKCKKEKQETGRDSLVFFPTLTFVTGRPRSQPGGEGADVPLRMRLRLQHFHTEWCRWNEMSLGTHTGAYIIR